jgi:2-methylcitrate dehydratase PrpD
MKDGTRYTSEVEDPKGDWRNPVMQEELEAKFTNLVARQIKDRERIRRIVELVTGIDKVDDVGKLFDLIDQCADEPRKGSGGIPLG